MSSNNNQTSVSDEQEFGPIRKLLWPIHNYELKKFIPLALIMFGILFNYTLLRDTKDTLVVNAAGASAITFLKLYCVTPCAILFVIFYAKLTNLLKREYVFYTVVTPFLLFFGVFGFLLYPNLDVLHPSQELLASINASYPRLSGFVDIWAYWSYSLFYVLAEIWGSAMIALMFWQFANQIVRMKESKRFYGLFVVISNVALILSGYVVTFCSEDIKNFYPGETPEAIWGISLQWLMGSVVLMGILTMAVYRWMHTNVLPDPRYYDGDAAIGAGKKKKKKPGLVESFKIIISSPELGLIAMLIMAYGVTINLVEVQWKEQLKFYFAGDRGGYNGFMGQYSQWTGICTILFSLFIGSNILRVFSWFKSAVITPTFILIGGGLFFIFILSSDSSFALMRDTTANLLMAIGTNPIAAATFLGAGIIILSKSIKYSLFDPTKEMAYIPLDDELKTKGKAAVDVIGGRAGKAGGAFVQNMLFIAFVTKDAIAIAPICFGVFAVVCLGWIFSVKLLSKKVNAAVERRSAEDKAAEAAAESATGTVTTAQTTA